MKRYLFYGLWSVAACFLWTACTQQSVMERVMKSAGKNRVELQKVLTHYAHDSLKLEAAKFLIVNMEGAYSTDPKIQAAYAPFYRIFDEVMQKYDYRIDKKCGEEIDSLWGVFCFVHSDSLQGERLEDAVGLDAATLTDEIDLAFEAWQGNVYTRNCSFADFCEYILPYRRANGLVIDDSRREFYRRHHVDFYASRDKTDFIAETDSLLYLYKEITHAPYYVPEIPIVMAERLEQVKLGTCEQRCWFNSLLLSSLGMASAIDFVPSWGNRNGGHAWNVIIVDGQSYAFEPFWDDDRWKYKRIYNNRSCDALWGKFRLPKVYRLTFANHVEGPAADSRVVQEDIPMLFRNAKKRDVSAEYFETQDVTLALTPDTLSGGTPRYAYLSVYNYWDWTPVQWGKIENGSVTFRQMGRDIVYTPTYYVNGKSIPAGPPFWLQADGSLRLLQPAADKSRVVIRNYAGQVPFEENRANLASLVGAELWGMKEGRKDKLLYTFADTLQIGPQQFKLQGGNNAYRLVRLYLPASTVALGDLSFYDAERKVLPNVKVLTPLTSTNTHEEPAMCVDGLGDTVFKGEVSGGYIEFDLGASAVLSSVSVTPYINEWMNPQNRYELAYWDYNGWQKVGEQQGSGSYLVFEDVPQGALLRLSDCDRFNKEHHRIFLYEEGKVIWL